MCTFCLRWPFWATVKKEKKAGKKTAVACKIDSRSGTKAPGTRLRHSRLGAVPELHARVFSVILVCIPRELGSCFACRESKLSTFGEYCGFVLGDKVSFEGYSFSVIY